MSNEIAGAPVERENFDNPLNLDIIDGLKFLFRSKLKIFVGMIISLILSICYDVMRPTPYISSFQIVPIENNDNIQIDYNYVLEKYQSILGKKIFRNNFEKMIDPTLNHYKVGKSVVQIQFDSDEMDFSMLMRISRKIENPELKQLVSVFNEEIKNYNNGILKKIEKSESFNKKISKEKYENISYVYSKIFEIQKKYNLFHNSDYIKIMSFIKPYSSDEYRTILLDYLLSKKAIDEKTYQNYLQYFLKISNYSLMINRNFIDIGKMESELLPIVGIGEIQKINQLEDENRTVKVIFIGLFLGFIFSAILCFGSDWFKKNNKKMFNLF